ncbi:hypothetical protein OF83DRAFT_1206456, partial [Amylostereum chailletii]
PIVSTANVSQLASDLLISSLELKCVGVFDPRDLVPVVGGRENGEEGVTLPLELYANDAVDIVSRKEEFIASVYDFIKSTKFSAVIFLSGVDLSDRTDDQMMTPSYYIRPAKSPSWDSSPLQNISNLPIPPYTSPVAPRPVPTTPSPENPVPFIPGGGLTRRILNSIPSSWPIPTVSLLQFVLEGDNRADAALMAAVVAKIFALDGKIAEWKQPQSWQQGLFGTPQDQTLYG